MYKVEVKGFMAKGARTVVESDTVDFADGACNAIYVSGAGDLVAVMANGDTATFTGLLVGNIYPLSIKRVKVASTAVVVALY